MKASRLQLDKALWPLLLLAGCKHIGPETIVADRIPYNNAIATSWQEQTLLNIVKVRYADTPFFVDVSQVVAGYQKQHAISANGGIAPTAAVLSPPIGDRLTAVLGIQSSYADRPTVSYTPQMNPQFIRHMTAPIPPSSVLFMIQSGYPADLILEMAVDSINGINNFTVTGDETRPADPRFRQLLQLMRRAQSLGHVGMRIERSKESQESVVFFFHDKDLDPTLAKQLTELRHMLGLDLKKSEFRVVFGSTSTSSSDIAILTRSAIRIYSVLSAYVDVPLEHLMEGRATNLNRPSADHATLTAYDGNDRSSTGGVATEGETFAGLTCSGSSQPLFEVHSGLKRPTDCFTAVNYRGKWFWVPDCSVHSKRVFSLLLVLQSLADTGPKEPLPVVTIQAN